jgi:hypothetical protein
MMTMMMMRKENKTVMIMVVMSLGGQGFTLVHRQDALSVDVKI